MQKIKYFTVTALALASVPAIALGQWTSATTGSGFNNAASGGLPTGTIYGIVSATLSWLLAILGFVAVMGFVISGVQYLIAAGDEGMIDRAKTNMKYSIIGVIVGLMGFVLVQAINAWLNVDARF